MIWTKRATGWEKCIYQCVKINIQTSKCLNDMDQKSQNTDNRVLKSKYRGINVSDITLGT